MAYDQKDATLEVTLALPNGAAATNGTGIQVNPGPEDFVAPCELVIEAPALTTAELPDAQTMTYKVQESADDSTYTDLEDGVLVQTGAGGAGDAAATERFRLPTDVKAYVRVVATNSGAGDASGSDVVYGIRCG